MCLYTTYYVLFNVIFLYRAVVSVILQSPSWKHALRVSYCPPHIIKCDRHTLERNASTIDEEQVNLKKCNTTPFRELIKTMPGVAILEEYVKYFANHTYNCLL